MKLLDLAPDIQEQILFLPQSRGLNERTLRPIVSRIDWDEQRCMFRKIIDRLNRARILSNDLRKHAAKPA